MSRSRSAAFAGLSATVAVAFGVLFYAFSVLITDRAAGSDFSTAVLSIAYGGTVLVGGGLAFVVGRYVDTHGVRGMVGIGSALGALGLLGLGASTQAWQVVAAAWLLMGPAGAMTFYEPAFVALDQWYAPEERGRVIGLVTVVGGLAGPIFLPLTATLVEGVGWRFTTVVLAAIFAVVGIGSALFLLPSGGHPREADGISPADWRTLLSDRRFVMFTAAVLLLFGSFQAIFFHRIALFEAGGLGIALVSFWAGLSGWLSFPGRYLGPVLATRPTGHLWSAAATVALAVTLFPMLLPERGPMILHFVVFGLVYGAVLPMRAAVMGNWYSGPGFGRIMGIQWTLAALAGAAGPSLMGLHRDLSGGYGPSVVGVMIALAASGALMVAAGTAPSRSRVVG